MFRIYTFLYGYLINYSNTVLFLHLSWHLCWKSVNMCESVHDYFFLFFFLSILHYHTVLIIVALWYVLKSGNVSSPTFFFKIGLSIFGLLYFHKKFTIGLSISIKNNFWDFYWDCIESIDQLRVIVTFILSSNPWMWYHLLSHDWVWWGRFTLELVGSHRAS